MRRTTKDTLGSIAAAVFVLVIVAAVIAGSFQIIEQTESRDVFMSGCIKMGLDAGLKFTETMDECESAWTAIDSGWLLMEDG